MRIAAHKKPPFVVKIRGARAGGDIAVNIDFSGEIDVGMAQKLRCGIDVFGARIEQGATGVAELEREAAASECGGQ